MFFYICIEAWPSKLPYTKVGKPTIEGSSHLDLRNVMCHEMWPEFIFICPSMWVNELTISKEPEVWNSTHSPFSHQSPGVIIQVTIDLQENYIRIFFTHLYNFWVHHLARPTGFGRNVKNHQFVPSFLEISLQGWFIFHLDNTTTCLCNDWLADTHSNLESAHLLWSAGGTENASISKGANTWLGPAIN